MNSRLGFMNSRAKVNLLNAGVLNCRVTATDVRNHTATAGAIIAEVRGKTRKMTASSSYVAPRVTQVQQSLAVDICFIKRLAYLIKKISPFGLGLVLYLKGIRSFHSIVTRVQRGSCSSNDARAQRAQNPSVNIGTRSVCFTNRASCPRGQESHEHGLPFVMCRVLLIYCVLFCMHALIYSPVAPPLTA